MIGFNSPSPWLRMMSVVNASPIWNSRHVASKVILSILACDMFAPQMPEGPDDGVDDVGAFRRHQPGVGIFVRRRYPGGAEQDVPQRQQRSEVLIMMLGLHRVMNPMPLRRVDPGNEAPHRESDVEVCAT